MRLPNAEQAVVAPRKLTDYLMAPGHPRGRAKAALFARLGFDPDRWRALADALIAHGQQQPVVERLDTAFGTWFTLEGQMAGRLGAEPALRTVWFIDTGHRIPRFITAYRLHARPA